ncbi:CMP-N-acetylneuraminate-beta-galactosamide-alpha-2, 3-sialyltransferase [Histophilus somni]|nr:CMP-N-acetylneuraminate-beta-galactosamide-alpha-2, 3-sialyltransferase [Histophilus somni]QEH13545.1 CMP-N-acetylneuraminate-beta-galactosamide-alpha-2, 3-sialyltransferase [Histophilus somni]QEH15342.1 CMP-N-acetylneuraminate-beta-galactosamide-alpha-2, 3-sialyltransferase [Histophilus somni]QEH18954.1 CMP-N-acetylneuraminate-beta-galactosamide-alpha-2, 3-sialyltransferase [Histophilus somni]QEH20753.1 CMP-N-acetylneuraminate-beta-galactosamide-alpha-2, 3-sialyltransferase [Histophilus som
MFREDNMNLIICCTPLQVIIAEKIIERYPEQKFYGVMLESFYNDKFDFYENKLKHLCHKFFCIKIARFKLERYKNLLSLLKLKNKTFDRVFLANIEKRYIHIILSNIFFKELYTFDDGTANIAPNSHLYQEYDHSLKKRITDILLPNHYNSNKVKNISKLHYSIYRCKNNIIDNIEYMPLFNLEKKYTAQDKSISILLGQPIFNDEDKNIQLIKEVIEKFKIDFYFPHPREDYHIDNISYIKTPLIFEEFYAEQSVENNIKIYTFFSSAVLNIVTKENIDHIYALKPKLTEKAYLDCYDILKDFGIKVIDI